MYLVISLILLGTGAAIAVLGTRAKRRTLQVLGYLVVLATVTLLAVADFWIEARWFSALGYQARFWREIIIKIITASSAAGLAAALVVVLNLANPNRLFKWAGAALAFVSGGIWGFASWEKVLMFLNRQSTGMKDPIETLGMDTGFYLFSFPFLDALFNLLVLVAVISAGVILASFFVNAENKELDIGEMGISFKEITQKPDYSSVYLTAFFVFLVLAFGKYLDRFRLMFSELGIVTGPGWTDVNIRIPAYNVMIVVLLLGAVLVMLPAIRAIRERSFGEKDELKAYIAYLGGISLITAGIWFTALGLVPGLFQALRVEPNEITFEKPYIKNNIEFTQYGFNLHKTEVRKFPVSEEIFTQKVVDQNRSLFDNIRLWDWRALDAVYNQFQEIRLYYEFRDVDIDRYRYNGDYRQVMVSAREIVVGNLPRENQTFVNRRFKYTHGYGITMTAVNEFTPEGLPDLLIKDIPPVSRFTELEVERPEIYYGELTDSYVVVNSSEKEFDYPRGDKNIYVHYKGTGGVEIRNLWDKFLLGWRFGGTRFFLSAYPDKGSRVMYHRDVAERVMVLAPFLSMDKDPYIVLSEGKLYWILDAYTYSKYFPYSEPYLTKAEENLPGISREDRYTKTGAYLDRINYLRNSVKVVVDAYNGDTDLYVFDEDDAVIKVWDSIFPGLLKKKEQMPEALRRHIRYPAGMLLAQGLVYTKYHMTDPEVFYNQEDLWVRATEKYYNRVQNVEPYYIMWKPPGSGEIEFTLILPFTPKNRQVLIGWIAGMCDGENYGRFLAYKFPKEKRVLGTQQVETKIDQDRTLSGQLTLWDQRGSSVIRGNVLAIPIEDKILYVEPIYLRAETAAYPELRLVVLMQNDKLAYGKTFSQALERLIKDEKPGDIIPEPVKTPGGISLRELSRRADTAFTEYLDHMAEEDFRSAAQALEELKENLKAIRQRTSGGKNDGKVKKNEQTAE
ncbi:MAG: UPF0182 family protein [Candidatus Omnitrophica bacterium]|nr:UPF0182 family protein [Candidatus Omnitrophota bacterium]